jgi:hypothetical protein
VVKNNVIINQDEHNEVTLDLVEFTLDVNWNMPHIPSSKVYQTQFFDFKASL